MRRREQKRYLVFSGQCLEISCQKFDAPIGWFVVQVERRRIQYDLMDAIPATRQANEFSTKLGLGSMYVPTETHTALMTMTCHKQHTFAFVICISSLLYALSVI